MIKAGEYNNSLIEGNWAVVPASDQSIYWGDSKPRLWHYCPKSKIIRCYRPEDIHPKRATCTDCREEPSGVLLTTFMML